MQKFNSVTLHGVFMGSFEPNSPITKPKNGPEIYTQIFHFTSYKVVFLKKLKCMKNNYLYNKP